MPGNLSGGFYSTAYRRVFTKSATMASCLFGIEKPNWQICNSDSTFNRLYPSLLIKLLRQKFVHIAVCRLCKRWARSLLKYSVLLSGTILLTPAHHRTPSKPFSIPDFCYTDPPCGFPGADISWLKPSPTLTFIRSWPGRPIIIRYFIGILTIMALL